MLTEQESGYFNQYVRRASFTKSFQHPNTIKEMAAMACAPAKDYNSSQDEDCGDIEFCDENGNSFANDDNIECYNVFNESNANANANHKFDIEDYDEDDDSDDNFINGELPQNFRNSSMLYSRQG